MNFGQLFADSAKQTPNKTALITEDVQLSYETLDHRVNQVANLLSSFGVKKGDRVALLCPNDYRFVEIVYGTMRAGAIPVPINVKLPSAMISHIVQDSEPVVLFYHEDYANQIAELIKHTHVKSFVQLNGTVKPSGTFLYDEIRSQQPQSFNVVDMDEDDTCFLLYTSGSTGNPKGCMLTHAGQYWNASALINVRDLDQSERLLIFAPLYHANALVNVQSTLLAGGSVVILPKVETTSIFKAIEQHQVTFMTAVPAIYKLLLVHFRDHPDYDLSSLDFVLCGSSELPKEIVKALVKQFHVSVLESYGLSEGGPVVFSSRRFNKTGSETALQKLPGEEIRIVKDGKDLGANEIGELWVRNLGTAKGYWNLPDITAARFSGDWLKTGDLASIDSDGNAYIAGRKDDMISVGGENTYPKEVENILLNHAAVKDVFVTAVSHVLKGQVPAAVVVTETGTAVTEQDLQQFFFANGPAYAYPRHVFFLDQFPLAGTGKVDKVKLRDYVEKQISHIEVKG